VNADYKIPLVEKLGYTAADAAANFVFMTMILFQLNFYTDTFWSYGQCRGSHPVSGRASGTRFFDPIMGVLADRTKTRWGKFRPWILWTGRAVGGRDGAGLYHPQGLEHGAG